MHLDALIIQVVSRQFGNSMGSIQIGGKSSLIAGLILVWSKNQDMDESLNRSWDLGKADHKVYKR